MQYISAGACRQLTVCSDAQYVLAPATLSTDRACANRTGCNPYTETETAPANATANAQCGKIVGAVACYTESEGPGDFIYAAYKNVTGSNRSAMIYFPGNTDDDEIQPVHGCAQVFGGMNVPTDSGTACASGSLNRCFQISLAINTARTVPCEHDQFVTGLPSSTERGTCSPGCLTNQLVTAFHAKNSSQPGQCTPMTICRSNQFESLAPLCCSVIQWNAWNSNWHGGVVQTSRFCTDLVPCEEMAGAGQFVGSGGVYQTMTDRQCTNITQCTRSELIATAANATSNNVCVPKTTTTSALSKGDDAGIAVGSVLGFIVIVCLLVWVYRSNKSHDETLEEYELTAKLLDDEREQNQRVRNAWEIAADQLTFGTTIASGASGTVYKGNWRHIPVAIKTPRQDNVEFENEEFQKEASLMQSIR